MLKSFYLIGALLALVSGALSFYFYGVYKGILTGKQWWIPSFWQMTSTNCIRIIETDYGKYFGVTNAALGTPLLFGYGIILFGTAYSFVPTIIPFIMGIISILIGVYLINGLLKLKMHCRICYTVHTLNLIILFLQLASGHKGINY